MCLPRIPLHDIAVDAASFLLEVLFAAIDLFEDAGRHDRQGDQLRMAVFQRGTGGGPMVLEDQDVSEPEILLQVKNPVAIGPEDIFHPFRGRSPRLSL